MTLPPHSARVADGVSNRADDAFWLARLDASLPRAQLVPDFKRSSAAPHTYESISFTLGEDITSRLKTHVAAGSDAAVCLSLLAVLLAKYHRQDELIVGLANPTNAAAVVPIRLSCSPDATLQSVVEAIASEVAEATRREPCSPAVMAELTGLALGATQCPFFDVAVCVGRRAETFDVQAYPVDVVFAFDASPAEIHGAVRFAADLYERARIERLVGHLLAVAEAMTRGLSPTVRDVDVMSGDERRLLRKFAGELSAFPLERTIHGLFEDQVETAADAIAAIDRRETLTYAQLNARANRLAHALLSHGLAKGGFVGILLERSCDFLAAMLAVFKAGGAYVPLDPTYPRERIAYMLQDSEAPIVISNAALLERFADVVRGLPSLKAVVSVDDVVRSGIQAATAADNPGLGLVGTDRAYMIYTSGSTGRPKGAICRHDGALNHLFGELDGLGIGGPFRFLQTAASSSDISVWQFVAPVLFGGATVIVEYDVVVDPAQLWAALREHRITVAEPVPVVLRALLDHIGELPAAERALPTLRAMMATGEALAPELVDRWLALYPDIPIANTYGPTETSDDVTLLVMRTSLADRRAVVPIGRPLPNVFIFILDPDLRPTLLGVPGEICIAGVGVGEGYWRQPDKTAAAFVTCPFPEIAAGAMYRTGDLGRWRADGTIDFLGRIDQQVKVRGFRVEPGEIEAVLTRHPAVQDAVVVAVADTSGTNRLVGYVVPRAGESVDPVELRDFLKRMVADHMVPAMLVPLRALPLTPLGKVDRKALASMELPQAVDQTTYVAPRDALEQTVAEAWSRVLHQRVGSTDNYFEIGGDSILIIQIIAELKRAGVAASPKQFFLYPTVGELATQLRSVSTAQSTPAHEAAVGGTAIDLDIEPFRDAITRAYPEFEDAYPLAPIQRGMYLQSLLAPKGSGAYVEQIACDLVGGIDPDALAWAWQHAVDTTDVVRAAVLRRHVPEPMQVIVRSCRVPVDIRDWRERREPPLEQLALEERRRGFDLGTPPLMRVTLVRLTDDRWHLLWTYHHLILDGWSEPLVLNAVFRAYDARVTGEQAPSSVSSRYRDFVAWSGAQDHNAAETFWRSRLSGFTTPTPIIGGVGTEVAAGGLSHDWQDVTVDATETARLNEFARRHKVTLGTLLHGAWALLLHRRTRSADVVFGSVVSGRQCDCPGIETLRGAVVATQPVRTRFAEDITVAEWLRRLQLEMAETREFEQTPLAMIEQWSDVPPDKRPLFESIVVLANYAGSDLADFAPRGMRLENVAYTTQPLYPLTLFVVPAASTTGIRLVYDTRRYSKAIVTDLLNDYRWILLWFVATADRQLGTAPTSLRFVELGLPERPAR
jgi:amino acid adenylation domain-containing protein